MNYRVTPVIMKPLVPKVVQGGDLHWVRLTNNDTLPFGAVIGGFENGEIVYVARATHNRSLCPGKYVPSEKHAFVAWGHRAHMKERFEVLCGFNLRWVKMKGERLPPHAFPGGHSAETNDEVMYIGRAYISQTNLIPGKIHMHYKTCYIPFEGLEKEAYEFEVLVHSTSG